MDLGTVAAMILAFSRCADVFCTAAAVQVADGPVFSYPDDDHVIITQYGSMRYRPVTAADHTNRPYGDGAAAVHQPSKRTGYYKAEVIPLDMKTWKPVGIGGWVGRGPVVGGGGRRPVAAWEASLDVPLRVGYSVMRRNEPVQARRRSNDYFSTAPPQRQHSAASVAVGHLWRL